MCADINNNTKNFFFQKRRKGLGRGDRRKRKQKKRERKILSQFAGEEEEEEEEEENEKEEEEEDGNKRKKYSPEGELMTSPLSFPPKEEKGSFSSLFLSSSLDSFHPSSLSTVKTGQTFRPRGPHDESCLHVAHPSPYLDALALIQSWLVTNKPLVHSRICYHCTTLSLFGATCGPRDTIFFLLLPSPPPPPPPCSK